MSRHHKYQARIPRFAAGIRAQSQRVGGKVGWWIKRWVSALEAMKLGARLGRGKAYALGGQVTRLVIEGSRVSATVQGSREQPYKVEMEFSSLQKDGKDAVRGYLRDNPMLIARLLVGDLPTELAALFETHKLPLFPRIGKSESGEYDVKMTCSCPDWMRPCKHIAAVLVLLGEEIARNPATLVELRGIEIEDLFDGNVGVKKNVVSRLTENDMLSKIATDPTSLLTRLGPVPFWRGNEKCMESLKKIYDKVRPTALAGISGSIDLRAINEKQRTTGADMKLQSRPSAV